jgi:hypothetical protein
LRPWSPLLYLRLSMTAPPAPQAPGFPPRIEDVPVEARVPERFGWLAGAAAIACAVCAFTWSGPRGGSDLETLGTRAGCVLGAILFAGYEIGRRLRRTVLVPRGGSIGVYRKGALDTVIGRAHMAPYELRATITFRYLWLPALLGPFLVVLGVVGLVGSTDKATSLLTTVGGAYVTAIAASIVWTRIMGKHFYIPKSGGQEEVIFTAKDLARIGG